MIAAPERTTPEVISVTLDLGIVIVSWNTRQLLEECLRSTLASIEKIQAEIWVVDNASTDGSPEMVREKFPAVHLIANDRNTGFAVANNQVLRQWEKTEGPRYVLLLNSDTVVPPGALDALVTAMDQRPDAAVCSPMLLNGDSTPQWCWARFPDLKSELKGELDRSQSPYPIADYHDPAKRVQMEPYPVDWVMGAVFLVRASTLPHIGLLDEGYFMYSEETDWCVRFKQGGHQILMVPAVSVTHLGGQSSQAVPLATRRRMWRSNLRFFRKTYGVAGGILPGAVSTARWILYHFKYWKTWTTRLR